MPCRKVVVEYCEKSIASKGTRDFLLQHAASLAHANPSVEFVIIPRPQRAPVLRGFYLNGRTKVISTHNMQATQIMPKMQLILDSSGAKTHRLKRTPVASTSESARGIWSPMHDDLPQH
ncbi:54S ribosomal protein L51, mitochondrial [Malassezia restricta CBS 7877]|uniref:Large ribosomal subunit protein mL43 n=2 Tax=Malassezia restricta TaxID=76775 RepID=A0A3G2SBU2_MALR7|nr:54S ribosomal protein L51, mitochondrial [Malassezia restricta CBS 7877]